MAIATHWSNDTRSNPLDILEEIIGGYDWSFERFAEDELMVSCSGQWCDYTLHFSWRNDLNAMLIACSFDNRIPETRRAAIYELLAEINCKIWFGHFNLTSKGRLPVFRQMVMFRGEQEASVEQLESLVEIAIGECERFYPVFQHVAWGGMTSEDAIAAALIETEGEA